MKLVLTEAALDDLRSIRTYTLERWGASQEERYLAHIWARITVIRATPDRFRRRDDLFPGCRIAAEGRHVILFRADSDTIAVVRVLHAAMDFKRHLPPGSDEAIP